MIDKPDISDLKDLNASLKAARVRAEGARAKIEGESSRGTPGHGAAEGGAARQTEGGNAVAKGRGT